MLSELTARKGIYFSGNITKVVNYFLEQVKVRIVLFDSDEKINFAAYQGMVAAKSKIVYFKHNNMEDLECLLLEYQEKEEKVISCVVYMLPPCCLYVR